MRRLDERRLEYPFAGARMLRDLLALAGTASGCKHVAPLMRRMSIDAIFCKPNTSRRHPQHPSYPCPQRTLAIDRPHPIWAMDITHIPMAKGFVCSAAVIDWRTRRVRSWPVSISLATGCFIDAVEDALHRSGNPEILNTDQVYFQSLSLAAAA